VLSSDCFHMLAEQPRENLEGGSDEAADRFARRENDPPPWIAGGRLRWWLRRLPREQLLSSQVTPPAC